MAYGANGYGGYNTYREIGVKTASQGKLVVMLYEAAVSNMEKALAVVDDSNRILPQNIENFGIYIQKVSDIITELQVTLDMEKGGEIASNLMALYIYFNNTLLDCSISHDKKKLKFIHDMLKELYDSWVIAANSTANTQTSAAATRPALNISG